VSSRNSKVALLEASSDKKDTTPTRLNSW